MTTKRLDNLSAILEARPIYQYVLLAAIVLLATALRFYRLGQWSFWVDEIFTVNRAQANLLEATSVQYWKQPPSLYLIAGALQLLGVSEWSARLAPALIGIVSIVILYFPIRRVFGTIVALLAVLLLAVSPWHLYWSQHARFYTAVLLFYTLAMFAFFIGFERDRPWYLVASWVLLLLAFRERVFAAVLLPVMLGYLILLRLLPFEKPSGYRPRNLLIVLGPPIAYAFYELFELFTGGNPPLVDAYRVFTSWPFRPIEDPFRMGMFVVLNIGVPLTALSIFSGIYLTLRKNRAGLFFFLGAVIPVALLVLANPFIVTRDRYVFVVLTSWAILGAVGVKELYSKTNGQGKLLALGVMALLVLDAATANLLYYQVNNGNRRDWRGAFALVEARSSHNDIVVSTWQEVGDYYMDRDVISWLDLKPDAVVQSGQRVWFVTDSEVVWINRELKEWVTRNAELVEVKYLRTPQDFALYIQLYDPERYSKDKEP